MGKFSETICGMAFRVTDKKNATRGIGYIRIGRVTGGAASLAALCNKTPI